MPAFQFLGLLYLGATDSAFIYFLKEIELRSGELLGIVLTTISGIFWGIYMVLAGGRTSEVDVLTRTTISMGLGSTPLPLLSMLTGPSWIYIVWLGSGKHSTGLHIMGPFS